MSVNSSCKSSRSEVFQEIPTIHSPALYPIWILLHLFPWQKPNTPKLTPSRVAKGICLITGVDNTDMSSKTNAANSNTVKGVAGLNMLIWRNWPSRIYYNVPASSRRGEGSCEVRDATKWVTGLRGMEGVVIKSSNALIEVGPAVALMELR